MGPSEKLSIVNEYRKSAPVDVAGLARALGIVVREKYLPDDLSGSIEPNGQGGYAITVNASHAVTRQRFTIAHELGHFLMHESLIGSGIGDDRAYRSTSTGKYFNSNIGPKEETEANKIAAAILMPVDLVKARKDQGVECPQRLAEEFGVSEHAMSIRLGVPYE
ncbi:MAG: ImmA/IrrE family metallo-endopeptidase [Defluviicoccus sp.]|nr:ImmA/IrrE family metallo-endopeptidase [Defluviicoccus sp.]